MRLRGANLGLELHLFDVEARKDGFLLCQLRLVEFELGGGALGVVFCLLDALWRAGDAGLQKISLARGLQDRSDRVGHRCANRCLGLPDQGALNVFLVGEIGEVGLGRAHVGLGLDKGGVIVGGIDLDDQIALFTGWKSLTATDLI